MLKKIFPLLIALCFLLSGCIGLLEDDPETDEQDDTDPNDDDGAGTEPNDDQEPSDDTDNETADPPVASLSANVTDGPAPLAVSFTLDAEHDDKQSLSWALDLGDGEAESGSGLPATVNHTFEDVDNFTVTLAVTSGELGDDANVTISVGEAAGGGANAEQTGTNGACLDYLALWVLNADPSPGVANSPLADTITVDPGTTWTGTSDQGTVFVDFFTDSAQWIGGAGAGGDVPADASYGIVCVIDGADWPMPPVPSASWTYQDGL